MPGFEGVGICIQAVATKLSGCFFAGAGLILIAKGRQYESCSQPGDFRDHRVLRGLYMEIVGVLIRDYTLFF